MLPRLDLNLEFSLAFEPTLMRELYIFITKVNFIRGLAFTILKVIKMSLVGSCLLVDLSFIKSRPFWKER